MDYIDFINKCETGSVYSIKEPILFPRFLKALLFEKAEAILFVSHSISTKSMAKSLYDICSKEELSVLAKMPIFFDDTPDMDFNGMVKRILPVIMGNNVRWLIIQSSDIFVGMNENELKRLANDFELTIITISM